jgi:hypothetical protein
MMRARLSFGVDVTLVIAAARVSARINPAPGEVDSAGNRSKACSKDKPVNRTGSRCAERRLWTGLLLLDALVG